MKQLRLLYLLLTLWTSDFSTKVSHGLILVRSNSLPRIASSIPRHAAASKNNDMLLSTSPSAYLATLNTTINFPSYTQLMQLSAGEFFTSDPFSITTTDQRQVLNFCVKLYPRGLVRKKSFLRQKTGFGMAYQQETLFSNPTNERVGVYLQYLGVVNDDNQTNVAVDATFCLRLRGRQPVGPKFDIEWRAGMRFVSSSQDDNLRQGRVNDFGAHLMQTSVLSHFMGIDTNKLNDDADEPLQLRVEVIVHNLRSENDIITTENRTTNPFSLRDIRKTDDKQQHHDTEEVRVGRIVIPVVRDLAQRNALFAQGTYPGVEYRILRIMDAVTGEDVFYSRPGVDYELKPLYPLVKSLERPWPVRVNERTLPVLYTSKMYNAVSAAVSLGVAVMALCAAWGIRQAVSLFVIPSLSMDPALQVGDVLLVEKVSPRLFPSRRAGDVVLFQPPTALQDFVRSTGGSLSRRDLFVKRVAAVEGSEYRVDRQGRVQIDAREYQPPATCGVEEPFIEKYIDSGMQLPQRVEKNQVLVLGDCGPVSIDSRVWGPLPTDAIVGRPIWRLWPLERFGAVQNTVESTSAPFLTTRWDN